MGWKIMTSIGLTLAAFPRHAELLVARALSARLETAEDRVENTRSRELDLHTPHLAVIADLH
jgi:hypothetical protein